MADYRDNWTSNPDYRGSWPASLINRRLERAVLRSAHRISVVSAAAAEELGELDPSALRKTVVAMNGFDEDDLPRIQAPRDALFRLTYAGSMRASRDPGPLLQAIRAAIASDTKLAAALQLHLVGTIPESVVAQAREMIGPERVIGRGFMSHRKALEVASQASVLIAISSTAEAGASAMTSKLFEYVALRRPVLFLAPPGPGRTLVNRLKAGETVSETDAGGIQAAIERLFHAWLGGRERVATAASLAPYTRRETARIFAEALDGAVAGHPRSGMLSRLRDG